MVFTKNLAQRERERERCDIITSKQEHIALFLCVCFLNSQPDLAILRAIPGYSATIMNCQQYHQLVHQVKNMCLVIW